MLAYALRRILLMIPTLFAIIVVNFFIIQAAPGGPVDQMIAQLKGRGNVTAPRHQRRRRAAPHAQRHVGKRAASRGIDPALLARLNKLYGFDKPPGERFWIMIKHYVAFDFGTSFFSDRPVIKLIADKLPVSISLGLWTTLIVYLISIPLGIAKAVRDGSRFDVWTSAVVIVGYAIPGFLFAILLIVLFAGGSYLQWFPLRGLVSDNWAQLPLCRQDRRLFLAHRVAGPGAGDRRLRQPDHADQEFLSRGDQQAICRDRARQGPERAPRALRPCLPQRDAAGDRRVSRPPSSASCSPARCWSR